MSADRLTDVDLDNLKTWAIERSLVHVLRAVMELQERRTIDRALVDARQRNVRTYGRRRK